MSSEQKLKIMLYSLEEYDRKQYERYREQFQMKFLKNRLDENTAVYSFDCDAVIACLLAIHRYEKKDDIMVSWLFHGRDQAAYQYCIAPLIKELPVAVSFDQIHSLDDLLAEVKEQAAEGLNNVDDPYIIKTTAVAQNDTFRIRNQGVMRNFSGIEGIPFERIELPNKDQAATLMNIQLLEGTDGEHTLCLTYGDQRYDLKTAKDVLELICESILKIVNI